MGGKVVCVVDVADVVEGVIGPIPGMLIGLGAVVEGPVGDVCLGLRGGILYGFPAKNRIIKWATSTFTKTLIHGFIQ